MIQRTRRGRLQTASYRGWEAGARYWYCFEMNSRLSGWRWGVSVGVEAEKIEWDGRETCKEEEKETRARTTERTCDRREGKRTDTREIRETDQTDDFTSRDLGWGSSALAATQRPAPPLPPPAPFSPLTACCISPIKHIQKHIKQTAVSIHTRRGALTQT